MSRDFLPSLFFNANTYGPLINSLNVFDFGYNFAKVSIKKFENSDYSTHCAWHLGDKIQNVHLVLYFDSVVCILTLRGSCQCGVWPRGVANRGVSYKFKYLGKIKTGFERIFTCLSGDQMGWNHEQNRVKKSRGTLTLRGKSSR